MVSSEFVKVGHVVTEANYDELTKLWYVDVDLHVYSGATVEELGEKVRADGKAFTRYPRPMGSRLIEGGYRACELNGKKVQFFLSGKDVWIHPAEAGKCPMRNLAGIGVFSTIVDARGFYLDIEIEESSSTFKQIMLTKYGVARIKRHTQKEIAEFLIPSETPG